MPPMRFCGRWSGAGSSALLHSSAPQEAKAVALSVQFLSRAGGEAVCNECLHLCCWPAISSGAKFLDGRLKFRPIARCAVFFQAESQDAIGRRQHPLQRVGGAPE